MRPSVRLHSECEGPGLNVMLQVYLRLISEYEASGNRDDRHAV